MTMKIITPLLLILSFAPLAYGQGPVSAGVSQLQEAGVGFSYTQANVPSEGQIGINGLQAVFSADLNRHFAIKTDFGYSRTFDAFHTGHSADLMTYMAGPMFYAVRRRKVSVYGELLLGAARQTGVNFENNGQMVLGYANEFAWAGGGGIQYEIVPSISVRLGADYLRTSFFNSNVMVQGQTNLRSSIFLVYTFGARGRNE
ncbi:MAG: outer membrane beta-barrel protein [Candidatus Acidiferrum sp.]|jgi:opacity protein-like surface antigen